MPKESPQTTPEVPRHPQEELKELNQLNPREITKAIQKWDNPKEAKQEVLNPEAAPETASEQRSLKKDQEAKKKEGEETKKEKKDEEKIKEERLQKALEETGEELASLMGEDDITILKKGRDRLNLSQNGTYNLGTNAEGLNIEGNLGAYFIRSANDAGILSLSAAAHGRAQLANLPLGKLYVQGKIGLLWMDKIIAQNKEEATHSFEPKIDAGAVVDLLTPIKIWNHSFGTFVGIESTHAKNMSGKYGVYLSSDPQSQFLYTIVVGGQYNSKEKNVHLALAQDGSLASRIPFNNLQGIATYMINPQREAQGALMVNNLWSLIFNNTTDLLTSKQQIEAIMDLRLLYKVTQKAAISAGVRFGHTDGKFQAASAEIGVKIGL